MISDRALSTLELDKILHILQEHASFSAGKAAALELRPACDLEQARAWLDQTSEARLLLETRPSTHLGGVHDVREAVRRAAVGAILTPAELLDIGSTLSASGRVRSAILKEGLELPWLRRQASRMVEDRPLVEDLEQTFSDRGEILDSASPGLRRIRNDIRTAQGRLMDRLNSMVASTEHRTSLQEQIVTMRNGRYVIPVRHEARTKIPGIVHDQSASGQTLFVEPLAVTEMNNALKELEIAEQREIERILLAISKRVAAKAPELSATVESLILIDVAFAKAQYATSLRATAPRVNDDGRVSLVAARHPLLRGTVVPITVSLGADFRVLVITGPNTGGKTVAMKTVGLLTLMAQSGLHIPAEGESEVSIFPKVFADIGDEQSIEQSLSTFSSHMRTIVGLLPEIDGQSLVLLDELGAGTDPTEGAALARALLVALLDSGAKAIVTTHYSELKSFAHETSGVENANVEFDVRTLSPTYRLVIGLPGRSQALAIAKRLGMPAHVLVEARKHVSSGAVRVEKLLSQIQSERKEIGRLFRRAKEIHDDAAKLRDRLQSELREIQSERRTILDLARQDAARVVRDLREQLREMESQPKGTTAHRTRRDQKKQVDVVIAETARALGPLPQTKSDVAEAQLRTGSTVNILSLGQQGTVTSVTGQEAEVQMGSFSLRRPTDDLEVLSNRQAETERVVRFEGTREAPPSQLDLRGWRVDEVLQELDQYLHDSYLHGMPAVRILHGKGTGALRKVVREQLERNPLVKSFQTEKPEMGGDGVTMVNLSV